jgi:hypothetical protein
MRPFRIGFTLLIIAASMLSAAGCNLTNNLTPDQIAPIVNTSCYMAAKAAVPKVISADLATKTVSILADLLPAVQQLQTSNDIAIILQPQIQTLVNKYIPDGAQRQIAVAVIDVGLSIAKGAMDKNAQFNSNKAGVIKVVSDAVHGTLDGLKAGISKPSAG